MQKEKITAIVLAGGSGKRMGASCKKQYMLLAERPLLYYSLYAFEKSPADEIVLVTNEADYCRQQIIQKYGFQKVTRIVPGGAERYHSVYAGLTAAADSRYVLIHDGARPFLTQDIINRSIEAVRLHGACIVGMPVKDTVKIADKENFAAKTLPRDNVWQIQTPQTFSYPLILDAYQSIINKIPEGVTITDDAMVLEYSGYTKIKLIFGSYQNIKITTSEDLLIAESFLKNREQGC
ncbi:MAG: 2-C-methyl-D-erythritol 4-phosphate cytidylyltransferase [Eubacterium sp.]|nr:2-C-methyl-D-erythritol 4-phosphate cytidylyltransferase [Eubacterium sp.]